MTLLLYNRLPDGAFLRRGGLLDQPAGLWLEVCRCGYIAGILRDSAANGFKATEALSNGRWDERDKAMFDQILEIRQRIGEEQSNE